MAETTARDMVKLAASVIASVLLMTVAACSTTNEPIALGPESFGQFEDLRESRAEPNETRDQAIQDQIASRMRNGGFEYVAFAPPQDDAAQQAATSSPIVDSIEVSLLDEDDGVVDPNERIVAELNGTDPAAAIAYNERLWGTKDELGMLTDVDSIDLGLEALGCFNFSAIEVTGGKEVLAAESALTAMSIELNRRVSADPRVVALVDEVGRCETAAGAVNLEASFAEAFDEFQQVSFDLSQAQWRPLLEDLRVKEVAYRALQQECESSLQLDATMAEVRKEIFPQVAEGTWSNFGPLFD